MYSGVILKYRDKCLLCKRSEKYSHPNQWFIPAGKIERGETPRESAVRELYEETDFELSENDIEFIGTIPVIQDGKKSDKDFIYIYEHSSNKTKDLRSQKDTHSCQDFRHYRTSSFGYFQISQIYLCSDYR